MNVAPNDIAVLIATRIIKAHIKPQLVTNFPDMICRFEQQ